MSSIQNELVNQVLESIRGIVETQEASTRRLTRIESRITQLMLFQGMETDGRNRLHPTLGPIKYE